MLLKIHTELHGRTISAIFTLSFFLALIADSTICTAGRAKPPAAVSAATPATICLIELELLINNANDIYEHAKLNKWKHIGKRLHAIKKAEHQSFAAVTNENTTGLLPKLVEATTGLDEAVSSQHRLDAMIQANKIMIIAAKMMAPFNPRIPTNIAVIGYSARKLEILAESHDIAKMQEIVYRIHLSWQQLIPQVIEHGGTKEIKKFAEIMKRMETAKSSEEYGRQGSLVLEEVSNLEQMFSK